MALPLPEQDTVVSVFYSYFDGRTREERIEVMYHLSTKCYKYGDAKGNESVQKRRFAYVTTNPLNIKSIPRGNNHLKSFVRAWNQNPHKEGLVACFDSDKFFFSFQDHIGGQMIFTTEEETKILLGLIYDAGFALGGSYSLSKN